MSDKGFLHIPIVLVILIALGLVVIGNVQTSLNFESGSVAGVLITRGGEDAIGKGSENSGSSNKSEDSRSGRGNSEEKTQPKEIRIKQEVRTSDQKIKEEIREDRSRIDVFQGGVKNRIQQKGNEFLIKTEIEPEKENKLKNKAENEATKSGEEPELVQELRAISKFPLRIDLSTNQLILTKNGAERVLAILPAKAVQNMLRAHLKKGLGPKFFKDATSSATPIPEGTASATPSAAPTEEPVATESAQLTILENEIKLEDLNGQTVYKIPAKKHLKILGFIPVTINITGYVSAETGQLLEERQSLFARIINLLSP
jgi:hypothetical protein